MSAELADDEMDPIRISKVDRSHRRRSAYPSGSGIVIGLRRCLETQAICSSPVRGSSLCRSDHR